MVRFTLKIPALTQKFKVLTQKIQIQFQKNLNFFIIQHNTNFMAKGLRGGLENLNEKRKVEIPKRRIR